MGETFPATQRLFRGPHAWWLRYRAPRRLCAPILATVASLLVGVSDAAEEPASGRASAWGTSTAIRGKATAIVDGDTFHLDGASGKYSVDLAGIDAPEKGQPAGDMAAQVLYLRVFQKDVELVILSRQPVDPVVRIVEPTRKPDAGSRMPSDAGSVRRRVCGVVFCKGCVNTELVRTGIAWHDKAAFASETLAQAEEEAREGRRGLWQSESTPVPPWKWRHRQIASTRPAPAPGGTKGRTVEDLSRFFQAESASAIEASRTVAASAKPAASEDEKGTGDYWLSTSSGVRHNSKCRYYRKSKGRPCSANEGRPCKICGG